MKRYKTTAFLLAFIFCALSVFVTGCAKTLAAPTGLYVDEELVLSWSNVENARRYLVEVTNLSDGTSTQKRERDPEYSLYDFAMGEYTIRVKSLADGNGYEDSDWSETLEFSRGYDTGCVYKLINGNSEYEITRVGKATGSVVVEDLRFGKPVTAIGDSAFRGSKIEEIRLGKNVKSIGMNAFYSCVKLTKAVLPEGLQTIGESAFQACSALKSINIPSGITSLPVKAFTSCYGLTEIDLNNVQVLETSAFDDCRNMQSLTFNDNLQYIGESAFKNNLSLKEVTLGGNVQYIGVEAFAGCASLQKVNFAENGALTQIGHRAFASCVALQEINLPEGVEALGAAVFAADSVLERISLPESLKSVGTNLLYNTAIHEAAEEFVYADKWLVGYKGEKANLTNINTDTLKPDTVGIASYVFSGCEGLLKIELAPSVKYINSYAFRSCPALWAITLGGVEELGSNAFTECMALKSVNLGTKLKKIGAYAFYKCESLQNPLTNFIPASVESIGNGAFEDTALWKEPDATGVIYAGNWVVGYGSRLHAEINLRNPYAPEANPTSAELKVGIADLAFMQDAKLIQSGFSVGPRTVLGMENIAHMGIGAFYNCNMLTNVVLNNSIKEVPAFAFYGCSMLGSVNIPTQLTSIGRSAFYNCSALKQVVHDNDTAFVGLDLSHSRVTEVSDYAFYGSGIRQAKLGSRLESLGRSAFYQCKALEEISIPDGVKEIKPHTFHGCSRLKSVQIGSGVEKIGDYAFVNCGTLKSVNLPETVKEVGNFAFYGCQRMTSLNLSNVESIGNYAFAELRVLTFVVIPESVKTIGDYAFFNDFGLQSVVMGGKEESMGKHVFLNCVNLTVYVCDENDKTYWGKRWNSSFRPVVWGAAMSEDGQYIGSVTIGENGFENVHEVTQAAAPVRVGYEFLGWSLSPTSTEIAYTMENMNTAPVGTTLYAVWREQAQTE